MSAIKNLITMCRQKEGYLFRSEMDKVNAAAAELERLQRIERAAVDLFQACSKLTIDDMDKIEAELNAMSAALKP